MGQEIAKRKQQQDEESLRAAAMERKKDKQEDREAREKVKFVRLHFVFKCIVCLLFP